MRSLTGAAIAVSLVLTAPTAAGAASYDSSGVFARSATAAGTATATAAAPGERLELLLALRADDAGLERYATAVGTPGSPLFRRYLEPGQIARRFGAPRADQQAVIRRLRASGISGRPGLGGFWIEASAGVAQAQRLFSTDLKAFRATNGTRFVAPVTNPSLPAGLRGLVIGVIGLDTAPVLSASSARSGQTALVPPTPARNAVIDAKMRALGSSLRGNSGTQRGCAAARQHGTPIGDGLLIPAHTPNQYLHAYGFDILHRRNIVGQGQRIAVIEIDGFKRSDLTAAARCFGHRAPPTPITRVGIKRNLSPGAETTLDLQVISAAAPGLKEIQVIQGANTSSAFVSQYARTLALPASKRPSVISASVGECEWNLRSGSTTAYVRQMDRTLKAAAAEGVTLLASAGDTGSTDCAAPGNVAALAVLSVDFPGSSQWVTSVGGTNIALDASNTITEEVVWNEGPTPGWGAGGGGYSRLFPRPFWQSGPGVDTTRNQRAVPDLALLADPTPGYAIYCTVGPSQCSPGWDPGAPAPRLPCWQPG